jgi:hypothetical protein
MAAPVALGLLCAAAPPAPIITAGQIVSTTVDVTKPPPAPLVKLQIKGLASDVSFSWTGPSGEVFEQDFVFGTWQGASVFQGFSPTGLSYPFSAAFNLFTEPGTWTLSGAGVCQGEGMCSSYSGTKLAALFGRLTIQVTNPNTPDIAPPVAVAGVVNTPVVSLSGNPLVKIGIAATDNLSGIGAINVCTSTEGTFQSFCFSNDSPSSVVLSRTYFMTTTLPSTTPTGTYTITYVSLQDLAGNRGVVADSGKIAKLFNGRTTITVTN